VLIVKEGDDHILVKSIPGTDGKPRHTRLANLGADPELNLYFVIQEQRRKDPETWKGIHDFHVLQALETFKRRNSGHKPPLVAFQGGKREPEKNQEHQ
jgi:hypothetical protein